MKQSHLPSSRDGGNGPPKGLREPRAKTRTAGPSALHLCRATGSNGCSGILTPGKGRKAMKDSNGHRLQSSGSRRSGSLAINPYFIEDVALTACELERRA